mmetsp:Transcript_23227/g.74781  ORF Transcript_23227/g.74781 Transcript_23227/m.74781 type:complete len:562 (-) Transcript_23227:190-1875(-)
MRAPWRVLLVGSLCALCTLLTGRVLRLENQWFEQPASPSPSNREGTRELRALIPRFRSKQVTESSHAVTFSPRAYSPPAPKPVGRGCVVYLVAGDVDHTFPRIKRQLMSSLPYLEHNFIRHYRHEVCILHTGLDRAAMTSIAELVDTRVHFADIRRQYLPPDWLEQQRAGNPARVFCHCGELRWGDEYCTMNRFFLVTFFEVELLREFDWWFRLDSDTYVVKPFPTDPFVLAASTGVDFMHIGTGGMEYDYEPCTVGLAEAVEKYKGEFGISNNVTEWINSRWQGQFMLGRLAWFRREVPQQFFHYFDREDVGLMYYHRLADQNLLPLLFALHPDAGTHKEMRWTPYLRHTQAIPPYLEPADEKGRRKPIEEWECFWKADAAGAVASGLTSSARSEALESGNARLWVFENACVASCGGTLQLLLFSPPAGSFPLRSLLPAAGSPALPVVDIGGQLPPKELSAHGQSDLIIHHSCTGVDGAVGSGTPCVPHMLHEASMSPTAKPDSTRILQLAGAPLDAGLLSTVAASVSTPAQLGLADGHRRCHRRIRVSTWADAASKDDL